MAGVAGGMRPKLRACLDAIHGGVTLRAHHRRAGAALAAARAVHRRGHRHEGPARPVITDALIPNYARYDVEFARGEGVRLWDAGGREYLDFLSGIGVCNAGHCHPRVVAAVQEQAAQLLHVSNLFYTEPMVRLAERLAARSLGGKVYFCNSGAEANEAALKLARKRRSGGRFVVLHGGFHGRTYGALSATPQETKQAPFAPLVPGFEAVLPAAAPEAVGRGRRGRAAGADPGRVGRAPAGSRAGGRDPGGLRRARRAADRRRGPDRDGPDGHAVGVRALRGAAGRHDRGEGAGRRAADRRAGHDARAGRRLRARRPRLDVRGQPARVGGRERRVRRARRPGAARARRRAGRRAGRGGAGAAGRDVGPRPRPDGRGRGRRRRARSSLAARCSSRRW